MRSALLLIVVVVGWIELEFDRPMQSVRPQVELSKPVQWQFRTWARLNDIVIDSITGEVHLSISEIDPASQRFKNGSSQPIWAPIQTGVLLTTLNEEQFQTLDLSVFPNASSGKRIGVGRVIRLEVIDETVRLRVESASTEIVVNLKRGSRLQLEIALSLDVCSPRESFVSCPFADFSEADLSRGDFERANLRGADLTGVNFTDAKLAFADLSGAIGRDINMSRAWLIGIDIGDAFLELVDYSEAVWTR